METVSDKKPKRKFSKTTLVVLIIIGIAVFNELFVHLLPLKGATKDDLRDYSTYPIMDVSLAEHRATADIDDNHSVYRIKWDEGSFLQDVTVILSFDSGEELLSSDQVEVECRGLFVKQVGDGVVNIVDGVAYVQVTIYRKTLCYSGDDGSFGFAVKIAE